MIQAPNTGYEFAKHRQNNTTKDRKKWDRGCFNTNAENLHRKCGRSIFFFVHKTVDDNFRLENDTKLFINPATEKIYIYIYFVRECGKGKQDFNLRRPRNPRDVCIRNSEF